MDNHGDARRRFLGSFGAESGVTDGPTQDLWFAPYWFWGATVGGLLAISVQIILGLFRGRFRARLRPIWFLEIGGACVIVRRPCPELARRADVRGCASRADVPVGVPDPRDASRVVEPGNASSEPPIAASSTAIIHLGTAVAVVGGLAWVGQLIVFLANVELYLPRRVRESMALGLLALLLAVAAICLLCLTRRTLARSASKGER